jgi:uncharacterized membrane protein YGL010W
MLAGRPWSEWIERYEQGHTHPLNQACHLLGIPLILVSLAVAAATLLWPGLWLAALALFVIGWGLQFFGHAIEGKPPEFFSDPRFLLVGVRWWLHKVTDR